MDTNKNTLKKQRQHENMKKDPQKYAEYLEKERLRQQKIRKEKKQFLKKHPMKAKEEREKKKSKQRELRRKKKRGKWDTGSYNPQTKSIQ